MRQLEQRDEHGGGAGEPGGPAGAGIEFEREQPEQQMRDAINP